MMQKEKSIMVIELDFKQVGARIRSARQEKNMTQEGLAALTGLSNEWICQVEKGKKLPLETLMRFCNALEKDPNYFLMDTIYVPKEQIIDREIADKLARCNPYTLLTVTKMLDVLLAQQEMTEGTKTQELQDT